MAKMTLAKAVKQLERVRGDIAATRSTLSIMEGTEQRLAREIAAKLGVSGSTASSGPSASKGKSAPSKGGQKKGRVRDQIIEYIRDHPKCQVADIAKALKMETNNVNQAANVLRTKKHLIVSLKADGTMPKGKERGGYLKLA